MSENAVSVDDEACYRMLYVIVKGKLISNN